MFTWEVEGKQSQSQKESKPAKRSFLQGCRSTSTPSKSKNGLPTRKSRESLDNPKKRNKSFSERTVVHWRLAGHIVCRQAIMDIFAVTSKFLERIGQVQVTAAQDNRKFSAP